MARRLTDLTVANTPLNKSEIVLVQQGGVDKQASIQNILDVGYLSSDFDVDFSGKTTDDLTEGSSSSRKYFFDHDNTHHTETYMVSTDITYELLNTNGDVGTAAGQLAIGNHNHDSVYVRRDGAHAMTSSLKVPQININTVDPSDTATLFGTSSGGESTFHIRVGNGVGDKISFESWNGSAATSLLEISQSTVTITGNLIVSGTTTTVNSTAVNVADSEIILNSNVTGTPSIDAALTVERGTSSNVQIKWNEGTDKWQAVDTAGATNIAVHREIKSGSGTFNATPGTATTISHSLGTATFRVSITPTSSTGGYLGEWYVTNKTTTTFDVVKTGSAAGVTFDWVATVI